MAVGSFISLKIGGLLNRSRLARHPWAHPSQKPSLQPVFSLKNCSKAPTSRTARKTFNEPVSNRLARPEPAADSDGGAAAEAGGGRGIGCGVGGIAARARHESGESPPRFTAKRRRDATPFTIRAVKPRRSGDIRALMVGLEGG